MTMRLYLYDEPADAPRFLPFSNSRPIGELRYGAWTLRERVERAGFQIAGHVGAAHLAGFTEPDAPPVVPATAADGARLYLRSSFAFDVEQDFATGFASSGSGPFRLTDSAGATVGALLPAGTSWPGPAGIDASRPSVALRGKLLRGVWEVVGDLVPTLHSDLALVLSSHLPTPVPAGSTVMGDAAGLIVEDGVQVEPHVVFDLRNGPIWILSGAEIRTFSRLAGPLVVGPGTRIVGGQIRESSLGPKCVVHGEVSNTVFLGYANKSHDGFVGHSIIGRWANLGAGTITSNLKNTYGPVRLTLGGTKHETGLTFLGSLVGDHVKTAIGTMLPTGCAIGTGANVFGSRRPEPVVPPFAWGTDEPADVLSCQRFVEIAERVMPRRDITVDEAMRSYLKAVWRAATGRGECD